jgi:hypothetical protein
MSIAIDGTIYVGGSITIGGSINLATPIETTITTRIDRCVVTAKGTHMAYTLPIDKLIVVQVGYTDAGGNAAKVDSVVWSSSNALVETTQDAGDMTICTITPQGDAGSCQVTADADADLGQGVRHLLTLFDITLVAGEAVAGTIVVTGDQQPIAPHVEPQAAA